jgi:putative flavoprotein involved in K+ transport
MSKSNEPAEHIHTVIIGAGQAGLSMSYWLKHHGIEHILLERARVGERWRSERWDSLRFQFPSNFVRLPGFPYDGDTPDEFMHRDGIVRTMERYAAYIRAPVRCGVPVRSVRPDGAGGYLVDLDSHTIAARNVVLATGPYQTPAIPGIARALPQDLMQFTANRYTNERQLPDGAVLVVGAGSSGYQIAEDLMEHGRAVFLAVGPHRRLPRRYRGRDIAFWMDESGMFDTLRADVPKNQPTVLMSGYNGGEVSLQKLAARGVRLTGMMAGCEGQTLSFADDLEEHVAAGVEASQNYKRSVDAYLEARGELASAPPAEPEEIEPDLPLAPTSLDLATENIRTVIWATGYRFDLEWVRECGVLDAGGAPVHTDGVSEQPGFYFLGLQHMRKVRSTFFWGVGDDAELHAAHIATRG